MNSGHHMFGWRFSSIGKANRHIQWATNLSTPMNLLGTIRLPKIGFYPWALILSHLPFDSIHAILGCFSLLLRGNGCSIRDGELTNGKNCLAFRVLPGGSHLVQLFSHNDPLANSYGEIYQGRPWRSRRLH